MTIRETTDVDLPLLAKWNRQLQEDEGALVMSIEAIEARFRKWFSEGYRAIIFDDVQPVGYSLYRKSDADSEGDGYYLRQFFVDREFRRRGYGKSAFECLLKSVFTDSRVILEVLESNPCGWEFWQAVGMTPYSHKLEFKPQAAEEAATEQVPDYAQTIAQ